MRMGIGLGIGINRSNYAQGIFNAYSARVVVDGGITEGGTCVDAVSSLLQSSSLLLVPSGYKGGKLYAEIPTNGNGDLTWTRASDAFRTNASGLIQRVPWNFASYSEDFSNAAWSLDGVTISANQIASPTGTTTADLMTSNGTGQQRIFQTYTVVSGSQYTISIYVKQGTTSNIQIVMPYVGAGPTFTFSTATFNTVSGWTSSVQTLANGWYRISATQTATSTNAGFQLVLPSNGSSVYLWGAQFDQNTTAQTYLPTTDRLNFPRLSYMYGSCPSVLLEPQRTNLLTYSNTPTDSSWSKTSLGAGTAPVVTANAATSPDGTTNASRVQFNCGGTTSSDRSILRQNITIANTTNYAGTFYVKAYSSGEIGKQLRFVIEGVTSQVIITLTDSWQRVATTGASSTTSTNYLIETRGGTTTNTTADVLIYGAQFEAGAFATTYIPTTSATATRVADSFSQNSIYTNNFITSSGGTWFFELDNNISLIRDAASNLFIGTTNNGNTNTSLGIRTNGATAQRLAIYKRISGTLTQLYLTLTDTIKVAIKWNGTTADVFVNGVKVSSATAFTTTNMEFLQGDGNDVPKFIQQMALYPSLLSDTDCTTLTTL